MRNTLIRRLCIFPIRIYQYCLSPLLPQSCRFIPSCSTYAADAVLAHGPVKGMFLAFRRIVRCHPLCRGGYDPVPPAADGAPHRKN